MRVPGGAPAGFTPTLATLADEALRDGIANEGFAALIATTRLEVATDTEVRGTLAVIARDEAVRMAEPVGGAAEMSV